MKSATIDNFLAISGYALYTSAGGCHSSRLFNACFIKSSSSLIGFNLPRVARLLPVTLDIHPVQTPQNHPENIPAAFQVLVGNATFLGGFTALVDAFNGLRKVLNPELAPAHTPV